MGSNSQQHPQVIIHGSLAQNLRARDSAYRDTVSSPSSPRLAAAAAPPLPNQPSPAMRDRTRSGGQTPRDMVWVDSKERLSEMATDIRGISNALSNVALAVPVSRILIVAKLNDDELDSKLKEVTHWLLKWSPDDEVSTKETEICGCASDPRDKWYTGFDVDKKTARIPGHGRVPSTHSTENIFSASPNHHSKLGEHNSLGNSVNSSCSVICEASKSISHKLDVAVEPCTPGNLVVYVENEFVDRGTFSAEDFTRPGYEGRLRTWNKETVAEGAENIDLIITLGGDGTVLYTSWLFQKMVPPTLSFGLGSLGFMTENEFEEYESVLSDHLTNGICCALRMRFQCIVMRTKNPEKIGTNDLQEEIYQGGQNSHFTTHTTDGEYSILNDVVVDRGPNPFVTMTELYGDYELLTTIKADGVVISTPTGSTSYSMSAGGSLVHPDIAARLISPICPHTLSFRPLVVPDSMALHIGVPYDARSSAFVSFDGKARVELRRGDFLTINVSRYPFPKVLPPNSTSVSWVQQLSRTLHWNEQKRPKRYTGGKTDSLTQ